MSPIFPIVPLTSKRQMGLPALRQLEVAQGTVWQIHLVGVVLVMHGESMPLKGTLPRHSTGFRTPRYCRCSCKHLPSFSGEETKFSVQASKLKTLAFESTSRLLAAGGTILSRSQLQRGHIVNCGASGTLLNGSGARYMYLLQGTKVFLD